LLFSGKAEAQRKSDIGFFGGTSFYMGDLNPAKPLYRPAMAFGPIYRYNFHSMSSLRISAIYHKLSASDLDFSDPFQQARSAEFNGSYIDFCAMYELNFRPYKTANRKLKYCLYTAAGIGYNLTLQSSVPGASSNLILPFSAGFKFNAGKRLSMGMEFSPRKLFNDKIDGISNISLENKNPLFGNKDWYTFAGVFLTYKIFNYREDCPAYEQ